MVAKTRASSVIYQLLITFVFLSLISCGSFFDSFFPAQVEYVEARLDLDAILQGRSIIDLPMRYVTTSNGTSYLVAIAYTGDGKTQVLFINPSNMTLVKMVDDSALKAANSGTIPALNLITAQPGNSIATGNLEFDSSLNPSFVPLGSWFATTTNLSYYRAFLDTSSAYIVTCQTNMLQGSSSANNIGSGFITTLGALGTINGLSGSSGATLLDANFWSPNYLAAVVSGDTLYFMRDTTPVGSFESSALSFSGPIVDNGSGWVTATAVILQTHENSSLIYQAYDWSGKHLSDLSITKSHQTLSLAFQPDGHYWYFFDASSGKLSKNKAWW